MMFSDDILKKSTRNIAIIGLFLTFLWFVSHLPFVSADADIRSSPSSRGPWTDEGLYSSQIRNYINHGHFNLMENDALLKTPLFSAYLFTPFLTLGTTLEVARMSVLSLFAFILFYLWKFKQLHSTLFILICSTLLFFPIHQYFHFALAEACSIALILLAGILFLKFQTSNQPVFLGLTFLFLSLAALFKLQFIYALAIPTLAIILNNLFKKEVLFMPSLSKSILYSFIIGVLMIVLWYLPFKVEFAMLAKVQGPFTQESISFEFLEKNLTEHFFNRNYILFTIIFICSLCVGIWKLIRHRIQEPFHSLLLFSLAWFILELHKLPMYYLPVRYVVSLYFAMGLFSSLVIAETLQSTESKWVKKILTITILLMLCINAYEYYNTWKQRSFVISRINDSLAQYPIHDKIVIGPWAPSLTWKSKSVSFPIWKDFLTTSRPIEEFKPAIVVSEYNEEDSGEAYKNLNVNLVFYSDSILYTHIAKWRVNVYWINPEKINNEY